MRIYFSFVFGGLVFFSLGANSTVAQQYRMFSEKKKSYDLVAIVGHNGVSISQSCLKKTKKSCDALKALQSKVDLAQTPGVGVIGNPAARYCLANNALNRILLDSKGAEYDFCLFNDGSLVDAWDLYNKHYRESR